MFDIEYLVFVIGLSVKKIQNVDRRMKNIGILEEKKLSDHLKCCYLLGIFGVMIKA